MGGRKMKKKKGLFIVLDGGEGSGKSTLLRMIKKHYGNRVVVSREPGGSKFAEKIRNVIVAKYAKNADGKTMFGLFWAAREDHLVNTIIPALKKGKIVVSDRFDSSTYAYQIVAQGARDLENLFWMMREKYLGEYVPDSYVYLDVRPEIGLARKKKQKNEKKNHFDKRKLGFHYKLREGFVEFFKHKNRGIKSEIIDAEYSKESVFENFKGIISYLTLTK
jgi:dTMP kinase